LIKKWLIDSFNRLIDVERLLYNDSDYYYNGLYLHCRCFTSYFRRQAKFCFELIFLSSSLTIAPRRPSSRRTWPCWSTVATVVWVLVWNISSKELSGIRNQINWLESTKLSSRKQHKEAPVNIPLNEFVLSVDISRFIFGYEMVMILFVT
jgi:hypothetical protein